MLSMLTGGELQSLKSRSQTGENWLKLAEKKYLDVHNFAQGGF